MNGVIARLREAWRLARHDALRVTGPEHGESDAASLAPNLALQFDRDLSDREESDGHTPASAAEPTQGDTMPSVRTEPPKDPLVPEEIRVSRDRARLTVAYPHDRFEFSAEFLRVNSPSAEVQGHGPNQRILVSGKKSVGIAGIEAVGNYAILIRFDDGHDTGIFSWRYLHELGTHQAKLWRDYETEISKAGLSR